MANICQASVFSSISATLAAAELQVRKVSHLNEMQRPAPRPNHTVVRLERCYRRPPQPLGRWSPFEWIFSKMDQNANQLVPPVLPTWKLFHLEIDVRVIGGWTGQSFDGFLELVNFLPIKVKHVALPSEFDYKCSLSVCLSVWGNETQL